MGSLTQCHSVISLSQLSGHRRGTQVSTRAALQFSHPRRNSQLLRNRDALLGSVGTAFSGNVLAARLALTAGSGGSKVQMAVGQTIKEPATSIEFAPSISPPGSTGELVLLGAGVRVKKIAFLSVNVYALGFYISPTAAFDLAAWKGKSASDLGNDFFSALANAKAEKAVEIVLARDVEGEQFWGALNEVLVPRLKSLGAGGPGDEALARFGDALKNRALKKNTAIFLTWSPPSTLEVSVSEDATTLKAPSSSVASIDSLPLVTAIFDVYLGSDPASPPAKQSIAEGFLKQL